jgi:hypothetical protein
MLTPPFGQPPGLLSGPTGLARRGPRPNRGRIELCGSMPAPAQSGSSLNRTSKECPPWPSLTSSTEVGGCVSRLPCRQACRYPAYRPFVAGESTRTPPPRPCAQAGEDRSRLNRPGTCSVTASLGLWNDVTAVAATGHASQDAAPPGLLHPIDHGALGHVVFDRHRFRVAATVL